MKIVTVAGRKGGQGKSTTVRNLSVAALQDGIRAACIDADDQGTLTNWQKRRPHPAPTVMALGGHSIASALAELQERGADLVFIDLPPFALPLVNSALRASDFGLIVTEPLIEALEQVAVTIKIVAALRKKAGIVINKCPSRSSALKLAQSALGIFQLPVCGQPITSLIIHSYSAAAGLVPAEMEPNGKAAREVAAVWAWLKKEIGIGQNTDQLPDLGATVRTEAERTRKARNP